MNSPLFKGNNLYTIDEGCVPVEFLVLGMMANNTYLIGDGKGLIVVDPSSQYEKIVTALAGRNLDAIVCTHNHYDHVGAAYDLHKATGAPVVASTIDAQIIEHPDARKSRAESLVACPVARKLEDNDVLEVGNMKWKTIATPGHTPGGICLYLSPEFGTNPQGSPLLISGDTLFKGTIGRTDFEGGSLAQMRASLKKLAQLPDNTLVLPGHNDLTSIGDERGRVFSYYA